MIRHYFSDSRHYYIRTLKISAILSRRLMITRVNFSLTTCSKITQLITNTVGQITILNICFKIFSTFANMVINYLCTLSMQMIDSNLTVILLLYVETTNIFTFCTFILLLLLKPLLLLVLLLLLGLNFVVDL